MSNLVMFSRFGSLFMFTGHVDNWFNLLWNSLVAPFCVDYNATNITFWGEVKQEWGGLIKLACNKVMGI
jgi:hypothetical protein